MVTKLRGENAIEAALQKLDRLTLDIDQATATQTLQLVNKAERKLSRIGNAPIDDRETEFDLQMRRCYRTSGNGFLLQTPGRTIT